MIFSAIHRLIREDKESALRMLYKFDTERMSRILMSVDTDFETVISRGGSDTISEFMNILEVRQLLKLFLETDDDRLFSHFQEICGKSQELMTKLLLSESPLNVRAHDGTTFAIKMIQSHNVTEFNWITFHIARLEQEQIVSVLNQTDNVGNTALLKVGSETMSGNAFVKWKKILSLFDDDEAKREYLIKQNYRGLCAFDNASSRICHMKTADGEFMFKNAWRAGYKLQRAAKRAITSKQWLVWSKRYLRRKGLKFVNDVKLLVPLFFVASEKYDLAFAKLLLSKINLSDQERVNTFLTTVAMKQKATVFHFAARNKSTGIMELLIEFARSANLDLYTLLSQKSMDGTDETPLIEAVKRGRFRIIKYLLSVLPERATELILSTLLRNNFMYILSMNSH